MGKVGTFPSRGKMKRIQLGSSPCDIKKLLPAKYKQLTLDNFALSFIGAHAYIGTNGYDAVISGGSYAEEYPNPHMSYDAQSGMFTYTASYDWNIGRAFSRNGQCYGNVTVAAYLYYVE